MSEGFAFDWNRDACSRHMERLRPEWPKGAAITVVLLFQAAASDKRVQSIAEGKAERLQPALIEMGPLCCLVGDGYMTEILDVALSDQPIHEVASERIRALLPSNLDGGQEGDTQ